MGQYVQVLPAALDTPTLRQPLLSMSREPGSILSVQLTRSPHWNIRPSMWTCWIKCFSRSYVLQLIREFRDGRRTESCIAPRYGRPRTATNADLQEMIQEIMEELDRAKSQEVADRLGVSRDSVRRMLQDMGYRYIMHRWVPHELTSDLKQRRVQTARSNLNRLSREPDLLDRIIAISMKHGLELHSTKRTAGVWTRRGSTP